MLREHVQNIGLILALIDGAQELITIVLKLLADIMAGRHKVCTESEGVVEQKRPADLTVADQAGIRRLPTRVSVEEVLHDRIMENILCIDDIKRDIELCGNPAR